MRTKKKYEQIHRIGRAIVAVLSIGYASASLALPDELQVQMDDINEPGQVGIDLSAGYAMGNPKTATDEDRRPTAHLLQASPQRSYGLTKTMQLGAQLFYARDSSGQSKIDGARLEWLYLPIRPAEEGGEGLFAGTLIEAGHLPKRLSENRLDAELRLIAGYRWGKWTVAANPEIGRKLAGDGSGVPDLSARMKLAYQATPTYAVGAEYYGDFGNMHAVGPLSHRSQQLFGVIDAKHGGCNFSIGIGRGLTSRSEPWVLKAAVGFSFDG